MDITNHETFIFILRIGGALLTLGSAVLLVLIGQVVRSNRLQRILWALIMFFGSFAVIRALSPFWDMVYGLIAANLVFLLLDIVLFIQRGRLKRAAPTEELQKERAGAIDEAIDFLLVAKKEIPR